MTRLLAVAAADLHVSPSELLRTLLALPVACVVAFGLYGLVALVTVTL